jgi:hypothetical protein
MSPERWSTLEAQLRDLGVLESEVDISEVLNTEFLPESN